MCAVCNSAEKCEHPWSHCLASRGEHCATCGHGSRVPRRPSEPSTPPNTARLEPEGAATIEGVPSSSGKSRVPRLRTR
jgi:hypothetical protein